MTNYCQETIPELKAQISQLKQEKEQLRLLTHELVEAFYKAMSKASSSENQGSGTLNPDLEQLLKVFSQANPKNKSANECFFNFVKSCYSEVKDKKEVKDD